MIEPEISIKKAVTTWAILVAMILASTTVFLVTSGDFMATVVALSITVIQWYIVGAHFMHLSDEPKWVAFLLVFSVLCIVFVFWFTYMDLWNNVGVNWERWQFADGKFMPPTNAAPVTH